jgi:hypothetical protein
LREAKTSVSEMKKLIELTSEIQLALIQQCGRLGSLQEERQDAFLAGTLNIMRDAGIDTARIEEIKNTAWDRYVIFDYAIAILGGSTIPDGADNGIMGRWKALRDFRTPASPDAIKQLLDEIGDTDTERRQLLEAYRYYLSHRRHRDQSLWSRRHEIPQLKVAGRSAPR